MGILLFELFRNPLFMGILNKWETLVVNTTILFPYGGIFYAMNEFRPTGLGKLVDGRLDLAPHGIYVPRYIDHRNHNALRLLVGLRI